MVRVDLAFLFFVEGWYECRKNFQSESAAFPFGFWGLFVVLVGVSGAVYFRFVVRFCIVCGAVLCCFA